MDILEVMKQVLRFNMEVMVLESSIRNGKIILQFCVKMKVQAGDTLIKKKGSQLVTYESGPSKT